MNKEKYFRQMPKVDALLRTKQMQKLVKQYGRNLVVRSIQQVTQEVRVMIETSEEAAQIEAAIFSIEEMIHNRIESRIKETEMLPMKRVINATGTILHTNLGRAPMGIEHAEYLKQIVTGYSNLEYNLEKGMRGERYHHFEKLLCELTGGEAALAVNNNAAAVLLILSTLLAGKEAVVSRGELVEIGGKFRIPDVMKQSGGILREVGTTNKTRLEDYEEVMCEETGAILKVHTSNYRIVGFTSSASIEELSELAQKHNIPLIQDLGSGVMADLRMFGLSYEPTVQNSIKAGVDVVCFSADKLLGGPQAGIIVGKKEYIEKMKRHPLMRALRVDKCTVALLEQVLRAYQTPEQLKEHIPLYHIISKSKEELKQEAMEVMTALHLGESKLELAIEDCKSQVGGGALPGEYLESAAVTLKAGEGFCEALEKELRNAQTPIICRISQGKVVLDMRTILEGERVILAKEVALAVGKVLETKE